MGDLPCASSDFDFDQVDGVERRTNVKGLSCEGRAGEG